MSFIIILYIAVVIGISLLVYIIYNTIKSKKKYNNNYNVPPSFFQISEEVQKNLESAQARLEQLEADYKNREQELKVQYDTLSQELKQDYLAQTTRARSQYEQQKDDFALMQAELSQTLDNYKAKAQAEQAFLQSNIDFYSSTRRALNEAILRSIAMEQEKEFYKIQVSTNNIEDIEIVSSIRAKLHDSVPLNKLVWTLYYQQPTSDMIKRVLNGRTDVSGIYKITSLTTGLVYIGKSTNIKRRWTDHVKTALGVGTLATSYFHRTMAEEKPHNFTFELLEEVPKENLTQKETYYINIYDTKNNGLNSLG